MENVVYLLGAGFSAPLGIPVMAKFIEKSRDLLRSDSERFGPFEEVLQTIKEMSFTKNFYDADLLNIEEVLSILEMREGINGKSGPRSFIRYITDVIRVCTVPLDPPKRYDRPAGIWMDSVFGRSLWALYGAFVASLFNLRVTVSWPEPMRETHTNFTHIGGPAQYSVVSLNYDLILETLCVFIKQHHACEPPIDFQTEFSDRPKSSAVMLAKLHGSIDTGEIIAPTWNKSLHPNLLQKWQAGYACLANANHIRILGYSLPVSDAYIKYLLKCAAIESGHLKRIDVLCRDTTGGVQARYSEFVHSGLLRFKPCNIQDYLQAVFDASMDYKHYGHERDFNKLENVHEAFMSA